MTQTETLATRNAKKPLPDGWRWVRLGDACEIVMGRTPRRNVPQYWGGHLPWVSIADLNNGVITKTKECITELGARESRSRLLKAGTLLFSFKLTIGKAGVAGVDLFTNEAIVGLMPKNEAALDREYLRFGLRGIDVYEDASHAVKGKTLNQDTLSALQFPLPSITEQRRIVAILKSRMEGVERARAATEAQLEAANVLPAAYLRAIFNSPEAQQWPRTRLGEVIRQRQEVVHPHDKPSGRATFVGLEHIEPATGRRIGSLDLEMSELTGRKPRFYKGDIVYGYLRPYLNKLWVAEFDGLCSVDQYVYRVDPKKADTSFIALFMRSPVYLERAPVDVTPGYLPRIRTEEVADVELNLPPLPEQRRIAAKLSERMASAERLRQMLTEQIDTINTLPAALLRRAFNGEL